MKEVWWMVGASAGSWLVAAAALGLRTGVDVLFGMIGPLAVASGSWVMAERTFKRSPERLTSLMIAAFAGKMVFFGTYVTFVLTVLSPRSIPFIVSFTGYFITLHLLEAVFLRRLFTVDTGAAR
jgi:hypothetical protein